ncbi:MAG: TIM barrel protein [Planctomycetota bacterium]
MVPGFHASSLEFHDPARLIEDLAALGFGAIAIRPCRGAWDAGAAWYDSMTAEISAAAKENCIAIIVDLDAPFYDDPRSFASFSLASDDEQQRSAAAQQIESWIERVADLLPTAITFSTGRTRPPHGELVPSTEEQVLERLAATIAPLCRRAGVEGLRLALRPVAEHAIATVAHFERFGQWLGSEVSLGLAADVGEMLLGGEFPIGARLARLEHRLSCVYLCEPDLDRGCDQRFGCGDIDLSRVWSVMTESGFAGPGVFRACGHGRIGLDLARQAIAITATL